LPQESLFNWWDKLQHILAFGMLSVGAYWAYPTCYQKAFLGLCVYGALIEILQSATTWRHGDVLDWVADSIGILLTWILVSLIQKVTPSHTSKAF
jgi:VanZ family protein